MTFARLAKLLAVLLVAAALWRARPPAPPARVAVLALPGAAMDVLAARGGPQRVGEIRVPASTTGSAFWRRLLAVGDDGGRDAAELVSLWSGEPAAVRALAVPARLFADPERAAVVESAFLGSSSGVIVEAADITAGRLPAPYDRSVDAVATAVATLGREEWSEWIPVHGPTGAEPSVAAPAAEFQFARFTDTAYFFSPAYIVAGSVETVGTPFLRGLDRELRPLVATHVIALAARRLGSSRDLFRASADARPVVVFDSVAEDATAVFAPDSTPAAVLDRVRDAIVAELATLRGAVGPDGLVVVVGGPSTARQAGTAPWYAVVEGRDGKHEGDAGARFPLDFEGARALVRYVAGISLDTREKSLLPADFVSRFPIRATVARATNPARPGPPQQKWLPSTLESVRGALGTGS